jgi:hypothetical protein
MTCGYTECVLLWTVLLLWQLSAQLPGAAFACLTRLVHDSLEPCVKGNNSITKTLPSKAQERVQTDVQGLV